MGQTIRHQDWVGPAIPSTEELLLAGVAGLARDIRHISI